MKICGVRMSTAALMEQMYRHLMEGCTPLHNIPHTNCHGLQTLQESAKLDSLMKYGLLCKEIMQDSKAVSR
jgi:hypothetical protein